MAEKDPILAARDEGFNMGTVAALAVLTVHGDGTQWGDVVRAAGTQSVLRHALTHEGDWKWGGFHVHAVPELGRAEVTKARRAVRARTTHMDPAAARTAGVPVVDEAQEAAYQRGKRAGYSEGFRAGRDGVSASRDHTLRAPHPDV